MAKRSFIDMIKSKPKIALDYLPKTPIELPEIADQETELTELTQNQQLESQLNASNQKAPISDQADRPKLISDQSNLDYKTNNTEIITKHNANNEMVVSHLLPELTTNQEIANHQINHQQTMVVNRVLNHQQIQVVNHQEEYTVNHQISEVVHPKSHRSQDRHAKSRNLLAVRLPNEFINQVKDFCKEKNLLLQDVVELALTDYMDKVVNHQNINQLTTKVANKLTHDDHMMIYKTHDDIIMLYRKLTNKNWSAADDRLAYKMNEVDLKIIEVGMIHTFIQAKGKKINSFAYFVPEIKNVMDAKFDRQNLAVYLKSRRKLLNDFLVKLGRDPINHKSNEQ